MVYLLLKKGTNVDALSRPVLFIDPIRTDEREEDANIKALDPWEDEALLYYLKNGKFPGGVSKKTIRRLKPKVLLFKLDRDTLYHRKDVDSKYLIWPKVADRRDIIMKAHLLGHYQAASTYDKIKNDFIWKNMIEDIINTVKECLTCQRHQKVKPINHSAQALAVSGIFDRIGIDLVFGLPVTEEGYKGILVITEYLTKFPCAYPIKSKQAEEIAEKLWEFISYFGPPKVILSDQGTEFNNSVVNGIVNWVGAEHRITSAYNPRTNGLTERFN